LFGIFLILIDSTYTSNLDNLNAQDTSHVPSCAEVNELKSPENRYQNISVIQQDAPVLARSQ